MTQRKVDAAEYDRLVRENERLDQFVQKVGKRLSQMKSEDGNFYDIKKDYSIMILGMCPTCHGDGYIDHVDNEGVAYVLDCERCEGSGRIKPEQP